MKEVSKKGFSNEPFWYQFILIIPSQFFIIAIIAHVDISILTSSITVPHTVIQLFALVLIVETFFLLSYFLASFIDAFIKFIMFYISSKIKSENVKPKEVK